tara:strand:+ start:1601 stop:2455 length:855 start_codon:yes stop_codon:yes gene_type:complete
MVLKKIGMTGSEGLVGSHLIPLLVRKNFKIIAGSKNEKKNKANVFYKKFDLSKKVNDNLLNKTFGDVDFFIHLGAILPSKKKFSNLKLKKVNLESTKKIINWAIKKKIFFIFFSTISIFNNKNLNYIKYKKIAEKYLIGKKLNYIIIRPSSIYGFGQKDETFLIRNITKIKNKKKLIFYKPFKKNLNFIHAHDISRAIIFLIEKNKTGIFNLINEKNISIPEIITLFKKIFNISKNKISIKYKKQKKNLENKIIVNKINKLGWKCKINLQNGIKKSFVENQIII